MKILAICLLRKEPTPASILAAEYDVSHFSFFQRSSVQEFLAFFASTLAEKTTPGLRQAVEQDIYTGYVHTNGDGLSGVIITDHEYPQRVAFNLLSQVMHDFMVKYPRDRWAAPAMTSNISSQGMTRGQPVPATPFSSLRDTLCKYQNPEDADTIMKVQREIDETKVILHKTIESMLDRGEKLDNLVDKSEKLSAQSKTFYKVAQKTNTCSCALM